MAAGRSDNSSVHDDDVTRLSPPNQLEGGGAAVAGRRRAAEQSLMDRRGVDPDGWDHGPGAATRAAAAQVAVVAPMASRLYFQIRLYFERCGRDGHESR